MDTSSLERTPPLSPLKREPVFSLANPWWVVGATWTGTLGDVQMTVPVNTQGNILARQPRVESMIAMQVSLCLVWKSTKKESSAGLDLCCFWLPRMCYLPWHPLKRLSFAFSCSTVCSLIQEAC